MPARGGILQRTRGISAGHSIAVDSKGNMDIGENFDARRVQRFLYKGLGLAELR
jgi:hypothetical protein